MLLKKNSIYNEKIDYLICKNLIKSLPSSFDEYHLRDVFHLKKEPIEYFEKDIIEIKTFLENHNLINIDIKEIEELIFIISKEKVNFEKVYKFTYQKVDVKLLKDLKELVNKENLNNKDTIIKICILISSLRYDDVPLIPYRSVIKRLCNNNYEMTSEKIDNLLERLLHKRQKYKIKHDLEENEKTINTLNKYAKDLALITNACAIGIYGSFATDDENEYSDLDLLIITKMNMDERIIKEKAYLYLLSKINIPIDIKVVNKKNIEDELTIGMKKSLKIIWEEENE